MSLREPPVGALCCPGLLCGTLCAHGIAVGRLCGTQAFLCETRRRAAQKKPIRRTFLVSNSPTRGTMQGTVSLFLWRMCFGLTDVGCCAEELGGVRRSSPSRASLSLRRCTATILACARKSKSGLLEGFYRAVSSGMRPFILRAYIRMCLYERICWCVRGGGGEREGHHPTPLNGIFGDGCSRTIVKYICWMTLVR